MDQISAGELDQLRRGVSENLRGVRVRLNDHLFATTQQHADRGLLEKRAPLLLHSSLIANVSPGGLKAHEGAVIVENRGGVPFNVAPPAGCPLSIHQALHGSPGIAHGPLRRTSFGMIVRMDKVEKAAPDKLFPLHSEETAGLVVHEGPHTLRVAADNDFLCQTHDGAILLERAGESGLGFPPASFVHEEPAYEHAPFRASHEDPRICTQRQAPTRGIYGV